MLAIYLYTPYIWSLFFLFHPHYYTLSSLKLRYAYIYVDIFEQFKDENGEFKKSPVDDIVGMLSLYEASYFGIHGEDVLDKAIHFTVYHLKVKHHEP